MNRSNIKIIVVAAVVIAVCLLYSWVQYGDTAENSDGQDGFEGIWEPVYSYSVGDSPSVEPDTMVITVADEVVTCTSGGATATYNVMEDNYAVSDDGWSFLYLEDGTLFAVTVPDVLGLQCNAYSKDASATLPDDPIDLSDLSVDMTLTFHDNSGVQTGVYDGTMTVDSHAFHVARGYVNFDGSSWNYIAFVMVMGDSTWLVGNVSTGDSVGSFGVYITDVSTELAIGYDGGYVIGIADEEVPGEPGDDESGADAPQVRTEIAAGDYFTYLRTENGETEEVTTTVVAIDGDVVTLVDSYDGVPGLEYEASADEFLGQLVADPDDLGSSAEFTGTRDVETISGTIECEVWTGTVEGDWPIEFTVLVGSGNGVIYEMHETVTIDGVSTEVTMVLSSTSLMDAAEA